MRPGETSVLLERKRGLVNTRWTVQCSSSEVRLTDIIIISHLGCPLTALISGQAASRHQILGMSINDQILILTNNFSILSIGARRFDGFNCRVGSPARNGVIFQPDWNNNSNNNNNREQRNAENRDEARDGSRQWSSEWSREAAGLR